jgi:hypothetical protein
MKLQSELDDHVLSIGSVGWELLAISPETENERAFYGRTT